MADAGADADGLLMDLMLSGSGGGFLAFVNGIGVVGIVFGVVVKSIPHSNRNSIFCRSNGSSLAGRASKC